LEVVRTGGVDSPAAVLDAVLPRALAPAEAEQVSGGGGNPRFAAAFAEPPPAPTATGGSCLVVSDGRPLGSAVEAALGARGVACTAVPAASVGPGFAGAAACLTAAPEVDAVVVALAGGPGRSGGEGWEQVLAEHAGLAGQLGGDAGWMRAVADLGRRMRLVVITDARTTGGRSRAQAVAQLARVARSATDDRVAVFAVSAEADDDAGVSELAAHLVCGPDAPALSGAELAAGSGWVGVRSHPRAAGSITLGGTDVPDWFDTVLRGIL
jgi:hypothetical protein